MLTDALADLLPRFTTREAASPERFPAENLAELYAAGIVAAPFPAALGGSGASAEEAVAAVLAIATVSPSTALIASMPLGLAGAISAPPGFAPPAWRASFGEQCERIAAAYGRAELYAACNSEKGAGGSLDAITTLAAQAPDGGDYHLSGEKILATGGKHATVFFSTAKLPGDAPAGGPNVEFFLVDAHGPGVTILDDWDGFGMRPTESQSVRYDGAAGELLGFPGFLAAVQPTHYWFMLFAAIPLGCAGAILRALSTPAPSSPAVRLRLSEATMRYEAMRAYLRETARAWEYGASPAYRMRVLRTKTYVAQEATKLAAELFALSGGRHYRATSPVARAFADSFAGTALRPPLPLALDTLIEQFEPFAGE